MRLIDDYDSNNESRTSLPIVYMTVGVAVFFVLIITMVLVSNNNRPRNPQVYTQVSDAVSENKPSEVDDLHLGESTLRSNDLDFWDMYKTDETEPKNSSVSANDKSELYAKRAEELTKEDDPSEGGTKTEITFPDGSKQWVPINASLKKNNFNSTSLVYQDPIMRYYLDGDKVSTVGVTITDSDGDIDFEQLKKAGVEFVMIRILSRGYASGIVGLDDNYYSNLVKATEAGLDIGLIVQSQAINKEEAEEEAQQLLDVIPEFQIKYPIAFEMETISNDNSRTAKLTKVEVTAVAVAFSNKIMQAGYQPIIKGNKYWLIRKVDLSLLSNYDIWLDSTDTELPDYPYEFSMWQYSKDSKIGSLTSGAKMSICFIDFERR